MTPGKYAIIDVGSSTTKVKIANRLANGSFEPVFYKSYDVPLLEDIENNGEIASESIRIFIVAMRDIRHIMAAYGVTQTKAIATEALRVAANSSLILDEVQQQAGTCIEIISEHREAELTLRAVQIDLPGDNIVCINGGGGSTELCGQFGTEQVFNIFNFGAKNLTDKFFKDTADVRAACNNIRESIETEFGKIEQSWVPDVSRIVSIGGSVWAAASFIKKIPEGDFYKLNGVTLGLDEMESLVNQLVTAQGDELSGSPFAPEKSRFELLAAGILVQSTLARLMNKSSITISTRSISDAVMLEF